MCVPENESKEILVPLTGSMYVPGKIADPGKVMVDIGTGYYVEKDVDAAKGEFEQFVSLRDPKEVSSNMPPSENLLQR